jgi:NAD(P)-dependent dehydrogenase (short-subunit alcohol dehydrogenase family)
MATRAKVVVITGCSTGLGFATATLLAKHGHVVYATMRSLEKKGELEKAALASGIPLGSGRSEEGCLHITQLDVASEESVAAAIGTPPPQFAQVTTELFSVNENNLSQGG